MALPTRRRLFIAAALLGALLMGVAVLCFVRGVGGIKSRAASITVGMTREQVVDLLGPPAIDLLRVGGAGTTMAWVDQLWQVDVHFDPDGRVERVGCMPSRSFTRQTLGRVLPLPK